MVSMLSASAEIQTRVLTVASPVLYLWPIPLSHYRYQYLPIYLDSSGSEQRLRHALINQLKEEPGVLHKLPYDEEVWVIRPQQVLQLLHQFLMHL